MNFHLLLLEPLLFSNELPLLLMRCKINMMARADAYFHDSHDARGHCCALML